MVKIPKFSGNLLIAAGIVGAAFLLTREIRGAGQDLSKSITEGVLSGVGTSFQQGLTGLGTGLSELFAKQSKGITDLFAAQTKSILAGQTVPFGTGGTTVTIPPDTTCDPITGICTSKTGPTMTLSEAEKARAAEQLRLNRERSRKEQELFEIPPGEILSPEILRAQNELEFRRREAEKERQRQQQRQEKRVQREVIVELPTTQRFGGGGPSFVGGTVRTTPENPIDTLSEVLKFFPVITTASKARDFLERFGKGILPSQVSTIDLSGFGQAGKRGTSLDISQRRREANIKAAEFTCRMFGLNCKLAQSQMA